MRNLILSNKAQRNIVILFIKKIDKFLFKEKLWLQTMNT